MHFKASVRGVSRMENLPHELLAMLGILDENLQEAFYKKEAAK